MKRVLLRSWIVLLLGICAYSGFCQGQISIAELESEIAELESEIALLETRVSQLERSYENVSNILSRMNTTPDSGRLDLRMLDSTLSTTQAAPTGELWKDKKNWRRLQLGMSTDAVVRILGDPEQIDKDPIFELWDYPGGGYIVFRNGRLARWSEP